ncbi:sulfurtransferase FdhD [Filimonas sp.]|nr:sulfurtransferase FdhD [Filimonas sp.]
MNATTNFTAKKNNGGKVIDVNDSLTVEEMLSISVNSKPYTITMRTPGFEEEHTRGILLTEDVYTNAEENPAFFVTEKNQQGYITKVNVVIPESQIQSGIHQQRNLLSVSSCGMCGKYEMDLTLHGILQQEEKLKASLIEKMFEEMATHQENFAHTGGCHASASFTVDGKFLDCKEDIGRHNAVDKVIGSLLLSGRLHEAKVILVSGRVSYEIVSKAHKAGIPFLCSVSAPSSMAVEYCRQCGITLLAFCRESKFTLYSNEEKVEMNC